MHLFVMYARTSYHTSQEQCPHSDPHCTLPRYDDGLSSATFGPPPTTGRLRRAQTPRPHCTLDEKDEGERHDDHARDEPRGGLGRVVALFM